jgi:F-type H+-transporting ATPase subunit gamma
MAKTQDLRRRIRSIGNTMQLTRAMKMVSAAKLRRAQDRILRARPYAERTLKILRSLSSRANPETNPLLQVHGDRRVELVVMTADKGLCGSFNAAIIRTAEHFVADANSGREVTVAPVGKKGRDFFRRRGFAVERQWVDVFRDVGFSLAEQIAGTIIDLYKSKELDQIHLVYNEFKSAIQCKPTVQQLLPVEPLVQAESESPEDYLYEPDPQQLFAALLPHYVEHAVYRALLESAAAEHAARMTAMESATNNASELIDSLTLTMNRVRQASITTEIIEVVSGAQVLG